MQMGKQAARKPLQGFQAARKPLQGSAG